MVMEKGKSLPKDDWQVRLRPQPSGILVRSYAPTTVGIIVNDGEPDSKSDDIHSKGRKNDY